MATNWTDVDPQSFLAQVKNHKRRRDAETLLGLMERVTGQRPRMFGPSIVGFGEYHYRYDSGHSGFGPAASFAPRSTAIVVYLPDGLAAHQADLADLGPHQEGTGCLYLKDLAQVNLNALERIIASSYQDLTAGTFGSRAADGSRAAEQR